MTERVYEMPSRMVDGVYVMLAPGFEETDVSTIARSLRRSGFSVSVIGLRAGPVRGAYGLSLASDQALSEVEAEAPQAVVLPGGVQAARQFGADPRVHGLLRRVVGRGGYVVAVDTAYTVLHSAGVLRDGGSQPGNGSTRQVDMGPGPVWPGGAPVQAQGRVVVDGQVVFGRDSGSAQEVALTLAALLGESMVRTS